MAEGAALLDSTVDQVQADRLAASAALQKRYRCAGVLKGAGSVLFSNEKLAICGHGNPGMATAGMGDVLSGVIGGLVGGSTGGSVGGQTGSYAAGDIDEHASALTNAVLLHSAAADRAAQDVGQRGMVATDVIRYLPLLLQQSLELRATQADT